MITSGTRKQRGWPTVLAAVALATAVVGFGASSASARDEGSHRGGHEWNGGHGRDGHGDWRGHGWERAYHPRGFYDYGYYAPPRVIYAPPPVVYDPPAYYPPSYYQQPSINFGFGFH